MSEQDGKGNPQGLSKLAPASSYASSSTPVGGVRSPLAARPDLVISIPAPSSISGESPPFKEQDDGHESAAAPVMSPDDILRALTNPAPLQPSDTVPNGCSQTGVGARSTASTPNTARHAALLCDPRHIFEAEVRRAAAAAANRSTAAKARTPRRKSANKRRRGSRLVRCVRTALRAVVPLASVLLFSRWHAECCQERAEHAAESTSEAKHVSAIPSDEVIDQEALGQDGEEFQKEEAISHGAARVNAQALKTHGTQAVWRNRDWCAVGIASGLALGL